MLFGGKQLGFTNFYSMSASCIAAAGVQQDGFTLVGKISTLLGILNKLCDFLQIVLFWILQHL